MKHYRVLVPGELADARALLERMDTGDQIHHFQQPMTTDDLNLWQSRARAHRLIGCTKGDRLVGMVEIARHNEQAECSIYIDPEHRGQGIGTELFERACAAARDEGAHSLTILVTRGDAEMLDMGVRHHALSVFRRGESMILPRGDHPTARWLVFDLDDEPAANWFSRALRGVRDHLGY